MRLETVLTWLALLAAAVLCLALLAVPARAEGLAVTTRYSLTFAPPHNEPVVGDRVARYRLQVSPEIRYGVLRYSVDVTAWGVNVWQDSATVGHGLDAWKNSDWSIEQVRYSTTHRLAIGGHLLSACAEYYMPLDRARWGGHGMERHYYLLAGICGAF